MIQSKILRGLFAAAGVAALAWWTCGRLVAPFLERERVDLDAIAALEERIEGARGTIKEIQMLEKATGLERNELHLLQGHLPSSSAHVWFPKRVKEHFGRFGVAGAVARQNTAREEKGLPGFERSYWAVELPTGSSAKDIRAACLAIAEFEPLEPSLRVLDVAIHPSSEVPDQRVVVFNIAVLSPTAGAAR